MINQREFVYFVALELKNVYTIFVDFLLHNISWMAYNASLAVVALVSGWLMIKLKNTPLKLMCSILWILFIPNTIYLVTDVIHASPGFYKLESTLEQSILIFQYGFIVLLGIVTFIVSVYPLERIILHIKHINHKAVSAFLILIFNFIVAFGVVTGRVQRTNSWEVFTEPLKVIKDFINVLNSTDLLSLVVFFGILNNFLYFSLKRPVMHYAQIAVRKILKLR